MDMPKPTEADKERFRRLMPDAPNVEVKPMFGNLGGFVNGNMFVGLFGSAIGVKLSDGDRAALLDHDGAGPFGPKERPMGAYVTIPRDWDDTEKASDWVDKALAHVSELPPKKKKAKKR